MSSGSITSKVAMYPTEIIIKGNAWGDGAPMELRVMRPRATDDEAILIVEEMEDEVIYDGFGSPILSHSTSEHFLRVNVKLLGDQEEGVKYAIKIDRDGADDA